MPYRTPSPPVSRKPSFWCRIGLHKWVETSESARRTYTAVIRLQSHYIDEYCTRHSCRKERQVFVRFF